MVTTARVTDGSPAALFGHSAKRDWESDDGLPIEECPDMKDLARQLIENDVGKNLDVSSTWKVDYSFMTSCYLIAGDHGRWVSSIKFRR